jgi:hypothetical protein
MRRTWKEREEDLHNPLYPVALGAKVAKFRRLARRGLGQLTIEQRRAYGTEVELAIRAKQLGELYAGCTFARPLANTAECASGTAFNDGADIHRAIRTQQLTRLHGALAASHRARTPQQWAELYDEAMADKRRALKLAA